MIEDPYVLLIGAAGIDTKGHALETVVEGVSCPGSIRSTSGGVARNVAENLSRLGESVCLISAIGEDRTGQRIKNRLVEAGVEVDYLITAPGYHTGAYMALFNAKRQLIYSLDDMQVLSAITPQFLYRNRILIHQAAMVVLDSNLSEKSIHRIITEANTKKVPIMADPTSPLLAAKLRPYLDKLTLITPNAKEASALTGLPVSDRDTAEVAAKHLVTKGVDVVVVTLGEHGVVYATSDTNGYVPALVTQVVDRTGASDALTAAVIFGLLNQMDIDEAVRLGASAAALTLKTEDSVVNDLNLDLLYEH